MAFSLRKSNDSTLAGLDIDGRFLAAATVEGGRVGRVASAELPDGVLTDGEVTDRAALTQALKDFTAANKLPRHVRLGVSNQQIVVRVLELPRIDDPSERDAALRFQAAEAIAMPLDEAVIDHQVAGYVSADEGPERMRVVVVAARRTMIEEYLHAAKDAGLKVDGIDLDAFALVRMLAGEEPMPLEPMPVEPMPVEPMPVEPEPLAGETPEADPLEPEALEPEPTEAAPDDRIPPPLPLPPPPRDPDAARVICHLGGVSNLAIAVGSACYFSRTLSTPFGAEGAGPRLADEIRLSIDYYMAQPTAQPVGDVLLSGEGAGVALAHDIGAQLGMPVGMAAPLGSLDVPATHDDVDLRRFTVAAGLALGEAA